jgi:hypothetical protein
VQIDGNLKSPSLGKSYCIAQATNKDFIKGVTYARQLGENNQTHWVETDFPFPHIVTLLGHLYCLAGFGFRYLAILLAYVTVISVLNRSYL